MTASTPAVPDLLTRLEQLRAAATPGPWGLQFNEWMDGSLIVAMDDDSEDDGITPEIAWNDAVLIVAAVNAVEPLVSAVREFAELEESYPLGSDVPVYRIGHILARLTAALDPAHDDERQDRG